MKIGKVIFFFILLFPLLSLKTDCPVNDNKWIICSGSFLKVNGSTNMNRFCCEIQNYCSPDTVSFNAKNRNNQISGELKVPISSFDCHHPIIKTDMSKTLQANTYKNMYVKFLTISRIPTAFRQTENIEGSVEITLAGTTEIFNVNFSFYRNEHNILNMRGNKIIRFTDFNLQPPKKFKGLVQTKDELIIEFDLKMKPL